MLIASIAIILVLNSLCRLIVAPRRDHVYHAAQQSTSPDYLQSGLQGCHPFGLRYLTIVIITIIFFESCNDIDFWKKKEEREIHERLYIDDSTLEISLIAPAIGKIRDRVASSIITERKNAASRHGVSLARLPARAIAGTTSNNFVITGGTVAPRGGLARSWQV